MAQALHTDQYALTMGQFYWAEQMHEDVVSFELFVRSLPKQRGYLVAAGLGTALWHLRNWHYTQEEMDFLRSMKRQDGEPLFNPKYLDYLRDLDFTCDVWAIQEGTPVGPQVPILRVSGPRIQGTLIESLLLSIINHQTMIASKAARIVSAAQGRQVWDFSLRRLHGPEASLGVARAAYIAGVAGTATVEAGRILKIPTTGTMAHAQVMAFGWDREQRVFEQTLKEFPQNHALLVDTYDTMEGVRHAITASRETDVPLRAIRIDSDLEETIPLAKALLDEAGFGSTKILVSNDLDEYAMTHLADLPVDGYGVGTMLGTSADAPHLGGVYKLVQQHGHWHGYPDYVMKLTPGKQTDPGVHQVWRRYHDLMATCDHLALVHERAPQASGQEVVCPLLDEVMKDGRIVYQPSLTASRSHCDIELSRFPEEVRDLEQPAPWQLNRSAELWKLRAILGDTEAQTTLEALEAI